MANLKYDKLSRLGNFSKYERKRWIFLFENHQSYRRLYDSVAKVDTKIYKRL